MRHGPGTVHSFCLKHRPRARPGAVQEMMRERVGPYPHRDCPGMLRVRQQRDGRQDLLDSPHPRLPRKEHLHLLRQEHLLQHSSSRPPPSISISSVKPG